MDSEKISQGFKMILEGIGEDANRDGLLDTPKRVARMYEELFSGLVDDPEHLLDAQFDETADEMIVLKDIPFNSMCEHHFLPFIGTAHVAYIPSDKIVGISKLARVVEHFAKRPQVQERLTKQIAEFIQEKLNPKGVAVVIDCEHSCMTMRGIKKPGANMVTTQLKGLFKNNPTTRSEFMNTIARTR